MLRRGGRPAARRCWQRPRTEFVREIHQDPASITSWPCRNWQRRCSPTTSSKIRGLQLFITDRDRHLLSRQTASGIRSLNFVPAHFSQIPGIFEEDVELDTFMVTVAPDGRRRIFFPWNQQRFRTGGRAYAPSVCWSR